MDDHLVITLIRHGKTEANEKKQYLGWTDICLSTSGVNELTELSKFYYPDGQVYISSDLKRCQETMVQIYGVPFITNSKWRELSFGDWELKTYEQLCSDELYKKWLTDFYETSPLNGESYRSFEKRIVDAFHETVNQAVNEGKREVVIVTHGGPIQLLMTKLVPSEKSFFEWKPSFGGGYQLLTTVTRVREGDECISYVEVPFKEKENGLKHSIS